LHFIRRPGRARERRVVFVVRAAEHETEVRRIELDEGDGLAAVDLASGGDEIAAPLVLVCAHGARDACCALRGSAVFGALGSVLAEEELWLSSHQGGHRFAANVLVLPLGIQLGRISPEEATRVVGDALTGHIPLAHYRGRTPYSRREQAAERAVREATGLVALPDVTLVGDDGTYVWFDAADGGEYRASVDPAPGPLVPSSCGAEPELQAHVGATLL
jgi:hypothetical protein